MKRLGRAFDRDVFIGRMKVQELDSFRAQSAEAFFTFSA